MEDGGLAAVWSLAGPGPGNVLFLLQLSQAHWKLLGKDGWEGGSYTVGRATSSLGFWVSGVWTACLPRACRPSQVVPRQRLYNIHVCAFLFPCPPSFFPHCCLLPQSISAHLSSQSFVSPCCSVSCSPRPTREARPPLQSALDAPPHLVTSPKLLTP